MQPVSGCELDSSPEGDFGLNLLFNRYGVSDQNVSGLVESAEFTNKTFSTYMKCGQPANYERPMFESISSTIHA